MKPRFILLAAIALATACGRGQTSTAGAPASGSSSAAADGSAPAPPGASSEQLDAQWARAREGEADELARLARKEGALGLVERGSANAEWRETALRALAYADGWAGLPWLAEVGAGTNEKEAALALESASALAARPRRAVDPEDALELRAGCDKFLALAAQAQRPKPVTQAAARTLRMLAEYGCPPPPQ
ncbi:hypothetical protein LVJ94_21135 [Pendulispora rubella]|uniref:Secreted protein n=1 Tax=Pendulispora rubella TaxID=2741070 RepID=A0ABZ2LKS2_9BACT